MKVFIQNYRKDGKVKVTYAYDTGRRLNKIITPEQLEKDLKESKDLEPHKTPFDLMNGR